MKIKKQYCVFILVFLLLLLGTTISYGTYSATDSTVESEGKVTVKVTSSEPLDAYNLDLQSYEGLTFNGCSKEESKAIININGSSIGYINMSGNTKELGTYSFKAPKVTEDKIYTITFLIDKKTTVTSKIKVKAPVVETPQEPATQTPTQTTQPPPTVTKSSEARLKNLGIKPNDFSGFKKDKLEYSTTVSNDVSEVEIYAEKLDGNAKIEGTGKVTLKEGNNTFKVKVTAEDGKTTKTYVITIKRKTAEEQSTEDGEARLKNLGIKPKEYDFSGFNSEKTKYSVEVPNEVEEIEVYATAMNSKAQITGTGMMELKEGVNELLIEVIAVDGTKKTYTLEVIRKELEQKEENTVEMLGLSILSIEGLKLSPSFKVDTFEYKVTMSDEMDENLLNITAKANSEDATVEIIGNENLQQGENVITILVKNEEKEEVVTYQIIVNKNAVVVSEEVIQKSWLNPVTWGKEEKIKIAIIIVLIILIICAIILKIKISKESSDTQKVDFPGAEELDKAIAEHQELSEEPSDVEENIKESQVQMNCGEVVSKSEVEQNYIEEIARNRFGTEEDRFEERTKRKGRHF